MFNYAQRVLFALSSASPMLIVAALIAYAQGGIQLSWAFIVALAGFSFFVIGGIVFLSSARKRGEFISVEGTIASIRPSGQWLPVLFGSYLIPLISLLQSAVDFKIVIALALLLTAVALATKNVPPAVFLLLVGYHFYELGLSNGAGGYKLISKRKSISDPKTVTGVVKLFANEYWLLEKDV